MRSYLVRGLAALSRSVSALRRALGRFGSVVAEFQRQQDRLNSARLSYDAFMIEPAIPPETYAEFLMRTSGALRHEPSARSRLAGHGGH